MELGPILSSLCRNRAGPLLIALQIALTLAVLCNALFIIEQYSAASRMPTGIADESDVFLVSNQWAGRAEDLAARERTDLAGLRGLPQVEDATLSPVQPLGGRRMGMSISIHPEQPKAGMPTWVFPVDDHALSTLGLRLTAGDNFRPEQILVSHAFRENYKSLGAVIITRGLARALDPSGNVLGHVATLDPGNITATIIGVVERLRPGDYAPDSPVAEDSILVPLLWADQNVYYFVRAKPGQLGAAMAAARRELYQISRQRTIVSMQPLAEARSGFYRAARGDALLMSVICAILLGVTSFSIVGLTSYWVSQRMRQIGIRRALGATAGSILRYFQAENLLIAGLGSILGILLGIGANLWLVRSIALVRLPPIYLFAGTIIVVVLGQLSVLWPALRAAALPPATVARSA